MEDKKTILDRGVGGMRRLSARFSYYGRLAVGKNINGEAERLASRKLRRRLVLASLWFTLSLLFTIAPLPFGARPVGISLFAALAGTDALFSLPGLLIGGLFTDHIAIYLLIPLLGLILRLLIKRATVGRSYFDETPAVRMAIAAALSFLSGFSVAAIEGFTMPAIYALLIDAAAAPLLTRIFFDASANKKAGLLREPGRCILLFFMIYALDTHGIFGFSFGLIAGFFITLAVAITNGALRGTLIGLVAGLACGIPYAPIFAVAGLCTGLCSNISLTYSVLASFALSSVMNLYLNGAASSLVFIGDLFFAVLIFLPLAKAGMIPQVTVFADEPAELPGMKYVSDVRQKFRKNRLEALSGAFDELSDVFLELSEKSRRPGSYELHEASDEVLSRYCKKCALNNICWQRDYSETSEAMDKLVRKLQSGETALADDLPDSFGKRCRHIEKIIREINNAAADLVEKAVRRDKTELFALDYEAMAELLNETAAEGEDEFEADKPLCRKASEALRGLGMVALGYSAWGLRKKTILASGVEISSLSVSGGEIREALEKETGLTLSEPRFDFNGDFVTMCVESLPSISSEVASAVRAKGDEKISGDSLTIFDGPCGNRFFLICDGMGSGRTAAITARISTVFLEKMLAAGNRKSVVLKMLSNFLRSKSEECHSTADLLELDLLSSRAIFTKCGAASSFVLHNGNLFRIDSRSVPVGITREITAEDMETPVWPGDLILLMSDGLAPTGDEIFRLTEALAGTETMSVREIADKLLDELSPGDDDRSLIVVRVTAA